MPTDERRGPDGVDSSVRLAPPFQSGPCRRGRPGDWRARDDRSGYGRLRERDQFSELAALSVGVRRDVEASIHCGDEADVRIGLVGKPPFSEAERPDAEPALDGYPELELQLSIDTVLGHRGYVRAFRRTIVAARAASPMASNTTGVAVPAVVPVAPAKSTGVTALSGPAYQRTRYPNSKGRLEPVQAPSACAVEGAEDDGPAEDDGLGGGRGAERGQERGPEEDGGDENPAAHSASGCVRAALEEMTSGSSRSRTGRQPIDDQTNSGQMAAMETIAKRGSRPMTPAATMDTAPRYHHSGCPRRRSRSSCRSNLRKPPALRSATGVSESVSGSVVVGSAPSSLRSGSPPTGEARRRPSDGVSRVCSTRS